MSIWIGLTGKNGSGKGEAAKYLKSKGFQYYSLSDVLRKEAKKRNVEPTRDSLYILGNEMRATHGAGVLGKCVLEKLDSETNYVIDSIRHPDEVQVFRDVKNFHFIEVYADPRIRFERMLKRAREKDPTTFEAFQELEAREAKSKDSTAQNLDATIQVADHRVSSNQNLPGLYQDLDQLLSEIENLQSHKA